MLLFHGCTDDNDLTIVNPTKTFRHYEQVIFNNILYQILSIILSFNIFRQYTKFRDLTGKLEKKQKCITFLAAKTQLNPCICALSVFLPVSLKTAYTTVRHLYTICTPFVPPFTFSEALKKVGKFA